MLLFTYATPFLASLVLSYGLTRVVRSLANHYGWVSRPSSKRHVHTVAVPRLGGVAVFLSCVTVTALCSLAPAGSIPARALLFSNPIGLLKAASIVFVLGVWDDFRPVNAHVKFGIEALAAALLYYEGFRVQHVGLVFGGHDLTYLVALPLTILWVLWITNAFNLIDGLDGLAAGSALISTLGMLVTSGFSSNHSTPFMMVILAGALLGFLRYNFNPATIFLGDGGSLFIGFTLSAVALAASQKSSAMVATALPALSFGLPLLDVGFAIFRRYLRGEPLFRPDGEHIHHKLLRLGFSHRNAVLVLYAASAAFGATSLLLLYHSGRTIFLVLLVVGSGSVLALRLLNYHEFFELKRVGRRTLSQKRIIANNLQIRRTADALRDCKDLPTLCDLLVNTLRPIGFDGFVLGFGDEELAESSPGHARGTSSRRKLERCWAEGAGAAVWSLRLELAAPHGGACGHLIIYRTSVDDLLWIDTDVLSGAFQTAVAGTLWRVTRSESSDTAYAPMLDTLSATATAE